MYKNKIKNNNIKYYILLHAGILIYASTGIFSKLAAKQDFFSFSFIVFYGLMLIALLLYAIIWQRVLKYLPLTTAFLNKSVTIIWGIIMGYIIFNETITANMIAGAAIVLSGLIIVVTDND